MITALCSLQVLYSVRHAYSVYIYETQCFEIGEVLKVNQKCQGLRLHSAVFITVRPCYSFWHNFTLTTAEKENADDVDESSAQENFEDKLKDAIEGLTQKR